MTCCLVEAAFPGPAQAPLIVKPAETRSIASHIFRCCIAPTASACLTSDSRLFNCRYINTTHTPHVY
jgi:hypothetical protein